MKNQKKYSGKKKILIIFTNFYSIVKMYLKYTRNKTLVNTDIYFLVEYHSNFEKRIKQKILNKFANFWNIKKTYFIKIYYLPNIYIRNILFFFSKLKLYRKFYTINKKNVDKYFSNNTFNEIWLSNTLLKNYVNFNKYNKIRYFAHSFRDNKPINLSYINKIHAKFIIFIIYIFTSIRLNHFFYNNIVCDNLSKKDVFYFLISLIKSKLCYRIPFLKKKPIVLILYQFGFINNYHLIKKININFAQFIYDFKTNNKINNFQFILKAKRDTDKVFVENLKNILSKKYKMNVKVFHKIENLPLNSEFYFKYLDIKYLLSVKSDIKPIFNQMYGKASYYVDYSNEFLKIINYYYKEMNENEKFIVKISNKSMIN
jgi:hypothetical protein